MDYRPTLLPVLLCAIYAVLSPLPTHGQLPQRLKRCLPYPTLADEIENIQKETEEAIPHPRVRVAAVTFEGAMHLPESTRARISGRLEQTSFDSDSGWLEAFHEIVTEALQEHGYFFAKVSAQERVLSHGPAEERVSVTFQVVEGPQYRLEAIQFAQAHVFPSWELRKLFALRDGDVFNITEIRRGIEALTSLYNSRGYINFTATPDVEADSAHQRISVLMELEEDKQFRVGSVEVIGLDPQVSDHAVKIKLKPGDIFNPRLVEDFYNENKSLLPPDVPARENTEIKQDPRNGTVAIVFDVWGCPVNF